MPYLVLFVAGLSGLVVMMVVGFVHGPHIHRHTAGRIAGRAGGRAALANVRTAKTTTANLSTEHVTIVRRGVRWLGPLLSPLTWFSWMFGAGAGGMIAMLLGASHAIVHIAAVAGAFAFQLLVVRPIWKLVFHFESQPAGNLEGCLLQEVEVVTAFNARGEGLVRLTIDGRTEDLLAVLRAPDRAGEPRPRRGDRLVIEDIDPGTNTCFVSRA